MDEEILVCKKCGAEITKKHLEKFGVIVCPKCKKTKAIELSHKTTKCIRCGKVLAIEKLKIHYKTNSEKKLRGAIGLVNADMDGKLEEFKKLIK